MLRQSTKTPKAGQLICHRAPVCVCIKRRLIWAAGKRRTYFGNVIFVLTVFNIPFARNARNYPGHTVKRAAFPLVEVPGIVPFRRQSREASMASVTQLQLQRQILQTMQTQCQFRSSTRGISPEEDFCQEVKLRRKRILG